MQRVKFLKSFRMYNTGEIAGFADSEAAMLVSIGAGELVIEETTAVVAEVSEKPAKRKPGRPRKVRKPATDFVLKG